MMSVMKPLAKLRWRAVETGVYRSRAHGSEKSCWPAYLTTYPAYLPTYHLTCRTDVTANQFQYRPPCFLVLDMLLLLLLLLSHRVVWSLICSFCVTFVPDSLIKCLDASNSASYSFTWVLLSPG